MSNDTTTLDTLDLERTDQLRTFLTVEAAADAATTTARSPHRGRRRVLGGVAAAVVLGGGIFAAASVLAGPGSGPAQVVETAHALEIESTGDGWTTIAITDVDADPDAIVAELTAAGIDARKQSMDLERDPKGGMLITSAHEISAEDARLTIISGGTTGQVGQRGFGGLSILHPAGGIAPFDESFTDYAERTGIRIDLDRGEIAIRDGSPAVIVVLTAD